MIYIGLISEEQKLQLGIAAFREIIGHLPGKSFFSMDIVEMFKKALGSVTPNFKSLKNEEPGHNEILRFIEFPPGYEQVGMSILTYFSTVLNQKFPDIQVKVKIEQEGSKIRMVMETPRGEKEILEKTFYEYGKVVIGEIRPREFLPNPFQAMQLERKLETLKVELTLTKQLLEYERLNSQEQIEALEVKYQQALSIVGSVISSSINKPFIIQVSQQNQPNQIKVQEVTMSDNRTIHTERDYFEHIEGNAHIATGNTIHGDNIQQLLQSINPQSPKEEVLKLFSAIQKEVAQLEIPPSIKAEAQNEINGAEIQIQKEPPDKSKMVEKLKNAVAALKGSKEMIQEAVTLGSLIGKAIEWGGEKLVEWII